MTLTICELSYFLQQRPLIKNITLSFEPGRLYGILGPNGSGKSTLLKTISRIWNPTSGDLLWKGQNLMEFSRSDMSQTIALVPQNPALYFDFAVFNMVEMGCYPYSRSPQTKMKVEQALYQVDAWHLRNQQISQLSGGERQRIYIARALASQSPVMLLDEPTSYLDLRHQLEIWQLLRNLTIEGKLVIVAVHDLISAQRFCDQLVILNQGTCQAIGEYNQIMTPTLLQEIFGVCFNEKSSLFELH